MSIALSVAKPAPSCSDPQLVAAVRDGNDQAFEELYSRYQGRVGSYILGMVGDHARAEDVAQEVFISALRRMRDTERPIMFKPWIYEIAKNACVDEFRRSRRAREVPLEPDREPDLGRNVAAAPERAVESKQQLEDLRGAFRGLSDSHHRVIVMRELEGLSYHEIAARLGITKATVESTLFRARRRLSEEYDDIVSGRRCQQIQTLIDADGARPLGRLGLRARRQIARHLAHCQPCRRLARDAGVDERLFHAPGALRRIAALFPWFAWRPWRRAQLSRRSLHPTGTSQGSVVTQLQTVAPYIDPSVPAVGLGRAAAAAAALVIGGAGGGLVTGLASDGGHSPARAARAPAVTGTGGSVGGGLDVARAGADGGFATGLQALAPFGQPTLPSAALAASSTTGTGGKAGSGSAPPRPGAGKGVNPLLRLLNPGTSGSSGGANSPGGLQIGGSSSGALGGGGSGSFPSVTMPNTGSPPQGQPVAHPQPQPGPPPAAPTGVPHSVQSVLPLISTDKASRHPGQHAKSH